MVSSRFKRLYDLDLTITLIYLFEMYYLIITVVMSNTLFCSSMEKFILSEQPSEDS